MGNERDIIRQNEPGYNEYDEYEGINSNVDLIKFEESMEDKEKRNSVSLNCSITDNVNGGFDVNTEVEEKRRAPNKKQRENVVFDVGADATPKKVQFVAEDDSDHDLFENMNVNEENAQNQDAEKLNGEQFSINALNDVLKVATKHNKMNENVDKEEEREKDAEEIQNVQSVSKVSVGATWVKIKSEVKNSNEGQNKNNKKNHNKKKKNRDKKQHKKNVVVAEKIENESEKKQNENNE